jgi:hypothetical protein
MIPYTCFQAAMTDWLRVAARLRDFLPGRRLNMGGFDWNEESMNRPGDQVTAKTALAPTKQSPPPD